MSGLEARETLGSHPHPNIAQSLGCVVTGGRVEDIVFVNHSIILSQVLKDREPFYRDDCLRGIEVGICHIPQSGLIYNGPNPTNIILDNVLP